MSEVLRGARLLALAEDRVDVVVTEGRIDEVLPLGSGQGQVVDLDGLLLMPGVIDAHVHPIHDETFHSVGRAAVFGGITTVCNQLYPAADEGFGQAMERMTIEAAQGAADFAAHLRWDRSRTSSDVQEGADGGALSIKVFLAHPDKSIQASLGDLVTAMTSARAAGLVTLVHAELGDVVDRLLELGLATRDTLADLNEWRSPQIEAVAIDAAAVVARTVAARLYVVHASCADALDAARSARAAATDIFVETCPHYTFLTAHDAPEGGPGFVLPPLRTPRDQTAVRAAILDGLVDTMGSDHCGHGHAAKQQSIAHSKAGLPGLEAMVPLMVDAALGEDAWLPPRRLVDLLCEGPARIFDIPRKGRIASGFDADLVAIDPAGSTVLDATKLHDAAGYSPYQGRRLVGSIERVWRRGELVVSSQASVTEGGGRLVRRSARDV